ncbi:MAG TPA: hypothetical protein VLF42_14700 [Burkholderiales bacterium]|nr:hypothetical protein [Burkholderiales bacterium]
MKRGERGAGLLVVVLLIVTVAAFAVVVAARQSGGDLQGTNAAADSSEALLLAETGVERAVKRFSSGTPCLALGESITDLSTLGVTGRSITVSVGPNSTQDFGGAPLPASQCRIEVAAQVTASRVTRRLQAIIDVGAATTYTFNAPAGPGAPSGWTGGAYDYTGGPDPAGASPLTCTRAAYVVRARTGGSTGSSAGTTAASFSVGLPATILVNFDYRIIQVGNSGSTACNSAAGGGACPGAADITSPGGLHGEICMTLRDTVGTTYDSTMYGVATSAAIPQTVAPAACTPTTQQTPTPAVYTPCSTQYNLSGASVVPAQGTVRFVIGGTGSLSFNQVGFNLHIPGGGQAKEMWVDNIAFQAGGGVATTRHWRDCSAATCPAV